MASRKKAHTFSATDSVVSGEIQPHVFPNVDELADMVEQVAGRIAEESLRSDQVAVSNQELVTQIDADPNKIELADGSAVMVSTIPPPLGKIAMSSECSPLVDPRLPRIDNIDMELSNLKDKTKKDMPVETAPNRDTTENRPDGISLVN